jgi:proteasome lid subunit RPN8/RPN11
VVEHITLRATTPAQIRRALLLRELVTHHRRSDPSRSPVVSRSSNARLGRPAPGARSPEALCAAGASVTEVLVLGRQVYLAMVAHCIAGAPLEACGLLAGARGDAGPTSPPAPGTRDSAGPPEGRAPSEGRAPPVPSTATLCFPARNSAGSARVYTVEPRDLLRADREAEAAGAELIGVFHSHTHTDAYPSPTDVAAAPDPDWHYVLVSLRDVEPVVRSYRIVDGKIEEEPVVLQ